MTDKALTVGMATYDDYEGTFFTIQSLRLHHSAIFSALDIIVIDNNPSGHHTDAVKRLCNGTENIRYIAFDEIQGTAAPRDLLFHYATTSLVLCIDCHVLIAPGALEALIAFNAKYPEIKALMHGPLLNNSLDASTHMRSEWRDNFYGIWEHDPRGQKPTGDPFPIIMHGLGLFACQKEHWPGFNKKFRGFGGEEGYIHEKMYQQGGFVLCLPFLRWMHRFDRPNGIPYASGLSSRIRNYIIGWRELGWSLDNMEAHFTAQGQLDAYKKALQNADLG